VDPRLRAQNRAELEDLWESEVLSQPSWWLHNLHRSLRSEPDHARRLLRDLGLASSDLLPAWETLQGSDSLRFGRVAAKGFSLRRWAQIMRAKKPFRYVRAAVRRSEAELYRAERDRFFKDPKSSAERARSG